MCLWVSCKRSWMSCWICIKHFPSLHRVCIGLFYVAHIVGVFYFALSHAFNFHPQIVTTWYCFVSCHWVHRQLGKWHTRPNVQEMTHITVHTHHMYMYHVWIHVHKCSCSAIAGLKDIFLCWSWLQNPGNVHQILRASGLVKQECFRPCLNCIKNSTFI